MLKLMKTLWGTKFTFYFEEIRELKFTGNLSKFVCLAEAAPTSGMHEKKSK
jgi:hypothetical protein